MVAAAVDVELELGFSTIVRIALTHQLTITWHKSSCTMRAGARSKRLNMHAWKHYYNNVQLTMCSYPKYVCGWNDTSSLVTMCFIPCQPIVQLSQPQLTTYQPEPIRTLSELNPGFPWQKHWQWQKHGNKTRWDKNREKYRTGQTQDRTLGQTLSVIRLLIITNNCHITNTENITITKSLGAEE